MKRFKFRLDSVLRQAEQHEERVKLELTWLRTQKQAKETHLRRLTDERVALRTAIIDDAAGKTDFDHLEACQRHIQELDENRASKQMEIVRLDESIAAKTDDLVEAMRRRQMLENLRERDKHEYDLAATRLETRLLDDTIMPRLTGGAQ